MNANELLQQTKTTYEEVQPHLRACADVFHDNEGELFTRTEAISLLEDKVDIDSTTASHTLGQLVGDTVDPIIQIEHEGEKYVGIIEFHEFAGAYGYINYDDLFGQGKRVVCQQCVNEAELDSEVVHATAGDPHGSYGDVDYDDLLDGVHQHYEDAHDEVPEDVETGASLASGTTIGGNTAFHEGNFSGGAFSDSGADNSQGGNIYELPQTSDGINVGSANITDTLNGTSTDAIERFRAQAKTNHGY